MHFGLRLAGLLASGLISLVPTAAGETPDTVLATVPAVRHLSAYRGVTSWSYAVGHGFRVAYRRGGVTRELAGSWCYPEPDPDLGPSRDGRSVVLVVSRCGRHGPSVDSTDTRSGRTVRLRGLGRLHCAGLISPSTWRGTIVVIGEHCGRNAVDGVYVRNRGGRVRRLIGLSPEHLGDETDVDGAHAAVSGHNDVTVRIVALRTGRSRVVWQGDFSASFEDGPSSPALDGGVVFWLETDGAVGREADQWLAAAPATVSPTSTCERQQLTGPIGAIAVANRRLVYATADAVLRRAETLSCVTTSRLRANAMVLKRLREAHQAYPSRP
jgi:hypothetical protein